MVGVEFGLPLQQNVGDEALDAKRNVLDRERVGRGGDQLDAPRHLRSKRADEREQENPEDNSGHAIAYCFTASMMAGTISNRSPTMP